MTYALTHMGDFLLFLLLHPPLKSQSRGPNSSLEVQIPTSRPKSYLKPKSYLQGPNSSLKGFGPQDWDLGLEAGILASWLRYGPGGLGEGGTKKEEEEEEEEKIPHMCESMGQRPLWGRCPKRANVV